MPKKKKRQLVDTDPESYHEAMRNALLEASQSALNQMQDVPLDAPSLLILPGQIGGESVYYVIYQRGRKVISTVPIDFASLTPFGLHFFNLQEQYNKLLAEAEEAAKQERRQQLRTVAGFEGPVEGFEKKPGNPVTAWLYNALHKDDGEGESKVAA